MINDIAQITQDTNAFHVLRSYHLLHFNGVGSTCQCELITSHLNFLITCHDVNYFQIDLHARRADLFSLLRPYLNKDKSLPHEPAVKSSPANGRVRVKSASLKGEPPAHSTQQDADRSEIVITFWTAENYRDLQETGIPDWQHINIEDTPCTTDEQNRVERLIKTFLKDAILKDAIDATSVPGLRVQRGVDPTFVFKEKCQAQWLPAYNLFYLKVENGGGGKCENERCFGFIFIATSHGLLQQLGAPNRFYDTTVADDLNQFQSHHATLRVSHS